MRQKKIVISEWFLSCRRKNCLRTRTSIKSHDTSNKPDLPADILRIRSSISVMEQLSLQNPHVGLFSSEIEELFEEIDKINVSYTV